MKSQIEREIEKEREDRGQRERSMRARGLPSGGGAAFISAGSSSVPIAKHTASDKRREGEKERERKGREERRRAHDNLHNTSQLT